MCWYVSSKNFFCTPKIFQVDTSQLETNYRSIIEYNEITSILTGTDPCARMRCPALAQCRKGMCYCREGYMNDGRGQCISKWLNLICFNGSSHLRFDTGLTLMVFDNLTVIFTVGSHFKCFPVILRNCLQMKFFI